MLSQLEMYLLSSTQLGRLVKQCVVLEIEEQR